MVENKTGQTLIDHNQTDGKQKMMLILQQNNHGMFPCFREEIVLAHIKKIRFSTLFTMNKEYIMFM